MALAFGPTGAVVAQSTSAGKSLYKTWCQVCHSVDPSTAVQPFNGIMSAANDPARITAAANADPSQMGFINAALTLANLADIAAYLGTFIAPPHTVSIVEFYSIARDHYFISASLSEIADLDHGVHPGWTRTGLSFKGFAAAGAGAGPVCRFYIPPVLGDSHFYSASPAACFQLPLDFPTFTYETPDAFYIGSPDTVSGTCAVGTIPVYRVWNARADTNHRYLTSAPMRQQMVAAGWIAEGYGPDAVIMCTPP